MAYKRGRKGFGPFFELRNQLVANSAGIHHVG
jgi:hypothetical protein